MIRLLRHWILSMMVTYLVAYLIDTGRKPEAIKLAKWSDTIMPKVKSGQLIFR